jgi:hypothetical protein
MQHLFKVWIGIFLRIKDESDLVVSAYWRALAISSGSCEKMSVAKNANRTILFLTIIY